MAAAGWFNICYNMAKCHIITYIKTNLIVADYVYKYYIGLQWCNNFFS